MLESVRQNSIVSNVEDNLDYQFTVGNELVRILEYDLNEYLHFSCNNIIYDPTSEKILTFFQGIHATLDNNKIPRYFNENHFPKE